MPIRISLKTRLAEFGLFCRAIPLTNLQIRTHMQLEIREAPSGCRACLRRTVKCGKVRGAPRIMRGHMTDERQHRAAERIRVELIEADVEIGFDLVDSALGELRVGNLPFASTRWRMQRRC